MQPLIGASSFVPGPTSVWDWPLPEAQRLQPSFGLVRRGLPALGEGPPSDCGRVTIAMHWGRPSRCGTTSKAPSSASPQQRQGLHRGGDSRVPGAGAAHGATNGRDAKPWPRRRQHIGGRARSEWHFGHGGTARPRLGRRRARGYGISQIGAGGKGAYPLQAPRQSGDATSRVSASWASATAARASADARVRSRDLPR